MSQPSFRPFGLEFLVEVTDVEAQKVNGGRHHRRKHHHHPAPAPTPPPPGGGLQTMHVSLPQPAFPTGDHG